MDYVHFKTVLVVPEDIDDFRFRESLSDSLKEAFCLSNVSGKLLFVLGIFFVMRDRIIVNYISIKEYHIRLELLAEPEHCQFDQGFFLVADMEV